MSKGAVGLTAGYWPEDVYRYLATPGISLDEGLVTRTARRRANHPVLVSAEGTLTYGQLSAEIDQRMKAILTRLQGKTGRVAIAAKLSLDSVKTIFGALKGRLTLFIMNPSAAEPELRTGLDQFGADAVIADDASLAKLEFLRPTTEVISFKELEETRATVSAPKGRLDLGVPTVAIPLEGGGIVYHSHKSLLSGAVSWSTFVPLKAEDVFLALEPLHTWEGIYSLFPVLFRGGTCLLGNLDDPERLAEAVKNHRPSFTILPRPEARKLYQSSHRTLVQAFRESLQGLFVSTVGPFTALGRRRLRNLLEKSALLTYGSPEAGPVLASHPTWYLDTAVGIPVTNVDVWPLMPATGNPLEVPWEAIEYAEIGVKSPMVAAAYGTPEAEKERVRDGWLRTKIVATMDPNGLFYLQSRIP